MSASPRAKTGPSAQRHGEIPDDAWTTIQTGGAVVDEQWESTVPGAAIAQIPFTAFSSRGEARKITVRLIVRRLRDANADDIRPDARRTRTQTTGHRSHPPAARRSDATLVVCTGHWWVSPIAATESCTSNYDRCAFRCHELAARN